MFALSAKSMLNAEPGWDGLGVHLKQAWMLVASGLNMNLVRESGTEHRLVNGIDVSNILMLVNRLKYIQ